MSREVPLPESAGPTEPVRIASGMRSTALRSTDPPWWQRAVIYEVYPRSAADGDGDGDGDLFGPRERLGYLADLGVDAFG